MTKRWDQRTGEYTESEKVDAFLDEIIEVCKKHGFSLGHEDGYGAFLIMDYNEVYDGWIMGALIS